ncbi:TcfC E-set like domain-containing protein [Erwinia phyllosphaerae]|uniref:TcfC E-set like domain-containing protein n=1 Tax=Erwinia phyllosphaerae TaxID=2853256 RepID=UPI001FF06F91|nr:TcfC E-set like domain-containing protein [Erwinia phyllosphaerae]MBV4367482.1 TcfC E-set like domain-containing protein [Erwinia phyllosphaerae]
MKKTLLVLAMAPLFASAADMSLAVNTRGLPEDFRRYFYDSEVMVQVYLNDMPLFDAAVSLKENGDIRLLRTVSDAQEVDPAVRALWFGILQQGVTVGKCTAACPSGLMAVEYRLDNSILKLYTSQYETSRSQSAFLSLPETPGGVIMYNDVSATNSGTMRSWGINSSLTSSFAGWSQKVSFQSSGTDGRYRYSSSSLYELYSQKELQGSFLRLGFFTPDGDTGNVQTAGFGFDTVAGAMWATSDALLASKDSVSAWPVYVTGRNQSIAEVWRDGRLIHTQQLQAGVQALNTRQLPGGIYDITIKIIENGQVVDTQQAQIYKPQGWANPDRRWRMNLWSGQRRTLASGDGRVREDNPFAAGGGVDILVHPRAVLGFSGAATEKEHRLRTRANVTLSPDDSLFAQYTLGNSEYRTNQDTDIRYYRNIPGGGSASLFWRSTTTDVYGHGLFSQRTTSRQQGDTWGTSLSLRLPHSTQLMLNGQYMDTAWRQGFGTDASVTTLANLSGRDMNFRFSAYDRPGFNNNSRDRGVSFGVSVSLAPAARHLVSAETGINQNQGYSSLNYQWQPGEGSVIRTLGGGVSYSPHNTVISSNASVDTPYASGDAYAQHNTQGDTTTLGGNLSQVLVVGGGKVASVNSNSRSMESALIVDVDADDDTGVIASGTMAETRLSAGRNIVPTGLWKQNNIQFAARGGESVQLFPQNQSVQMNRGSVQYIKVKAVKTFTLVGMLHDEQGNLLKNRFVSSDVSSGVINAEGVLTLDSGVANSVLTVRAEPGQPALTCTLPSGLDRAKKVQFIDAVRCRTVNTGADK